MPASRGALLNHRYELKLMLESVKEIEAMNRTDVSAMVIKTQQLEKMIKYPKIGKLNEDVNYQ